MHNSKLEGAIQAYWESSSNGLKGEYLELSIATLQELQGITFNERLARVSLESLIKITHRRGFRKTA